MPDKYTKAVAVTPSDVTDLTTTAEGIYIGDGDYTDDDAYATLAGDAGAADWVGRAENVVTVTERGATTYFLDNQGSTGGSALMDAEFKTTSGVNIPLVITTEEDLNYKAALSFNGQGYITIPDHADFDFDDDFSVVMLVKWTDVASGNREAILAKDFTDSSWMLFKSPANILKVLSSGSDPSSGLTVVNDTWYIIEWSRSSGTQTIYVNGESLGTPVTNTTDYSNSVDTYIGIGNDSGTTSPFKGNFAFLAVWEDSTLSAADRVAVVNHLTDRYLTTPQVDVAYIASDDTSSITSKRLKRGTVHPLAVKRVMDTGTDGSSIVALYE